MALQPCHFLVSGLNFQFPVGNQSSIGILLLTLMGNLAFVITNHVLLSQDSMSDSFGLRHLRRAL